MPLLADATLATRTHEPSIHRPRVRIAPDICIGPTYATETHTLTAILSVRAKNIANKANMQRAQGARVAQLDHLACGRRILDKLRRAHTRVSMRGCVCGGFESPVVPARKSDVEELKQVQEGC